MSSSSFFTVPGSGKKRKRAAVPTSSDSTKKRRATTKTNTTSSSYSSSSKLAGSSSKAPSSRSASAPQKKNKQKAVERDESISGSDSEDYDDAEQIPERGESGESGDESDASDGKELTAAERRLRLAERYLANVREEVDDYGFDAADLDKDLIAERLQEDVAEAKGKVYRNLSTELDFEKASQCIWRWNSDVITSIAACGSYAYTVSRDIYLTKFKIQDLPQNQWPQTTKKKPQKPPAPPKRRPDRVAFRRGNTKKAKDRNFKGHTDSILAVAVSHDGKFVATGGEDSRIVLWDAEKLVPLRTFFHHRDAVTGLAWRRGTHQLYSSSKDRTVKIWSMDEQAYVDTLYGHQDSIVDVDALAQERCVTVGSRDRTARLWKVVEETQSIFRGGSADKKAKQEGLDPKSLAAEGSIDRVAMIDEQLFVSGGDSGQIALWSIEKKKPLFLLQYAHGFDPPLEPATASAEEVPDPSVVPPPQPRWITALRTIPYTDLVLSGSWDGCVRVWRLSSDKRRLEAVGVLGQAAPSATPSSSSKKSNDQNTTTATTSTTATTNTNTTVANNNNNQKKTQKKVNGHTTATTTKIIHHEDHSHAADKQIRGIVNDIAVFERGDRGDDGLSVVCAVGREHRLGRWHAVSASASASASQSQSRSRVPGARNGGVVFEIPRRLLLATNGVAGHSDDDGQDDDGGDKGRARGKGVK